MKKTAQLVNPQHTTLRLAVTGLSGAGKTVFITSLIQHLLNPQELTSCNLATSPTENRLVIFPMLEENPHNIEQTFDYYGHRKALMEPPPHWPQATKRQRSRVINIKYKPKDWRRHLLPGMHKLRLEIFDYPGEWLVDIPMLEQGFGQWSREVLAAVRQSPQDSARKWLDIVEQTDPNTPAKEALVRKLVESYKSYLLDCKNGDNKISWLQPGHMIVPDINDDSRTLNFCPLNIREGQKLKKGSLGRVMLRSYQLYRKAVVRPFFMQNFARTDAHILLVDLLSHLDAGRESVADLKLCVNRLLKLTGPKEPGFFARLRGKKPPRMLFVATKADRVPDDDTPADNATLDEQRQWRSNLHALLDNMLQSDIIKSRATDAKVSTAIVAAVRATQRNRDHTGQLQGYIAQGSARELASATIPPVPPCIEDYYDMLRESPLNYPAFQPPDYLWRQNIKSQGRKSHINMDKVVNFILQETLKWPQ